jgi:hypothetical protein
MWQDIHPNFLTSDLHSFAFVYKLQMLQAGNYEEVDIASIHKNHNNSHAGLSDALLAKALPLVDLDRRLYTIALKWHQQALKQFYPNFPNDADYAADQKSFLQINSAVVFYASDQQQQNDHHPCLDEHKKMKYPASSLIASWYSPGDDEYEILAQSWGGLPPFVKFSPAPCDSHDHSPM